MENPFSSDDLGLAIARTSRALSALSETAKCVEQSWVSFVTVIDKYCDDAVDRMTTPAQRDIYHALIACGTPRLDAICEAHELVP